jgi:dienelactone hydrolase
MRLALSLILFVFTAEMAIAEIQSKRVLYRHGDLQLEGYLAWDDTLTGKRPGVLVVHEWWGLNDYVQRRVKQLAGLGYIAFALDMYGKGKVTEHPDQADKWMRAVQTSVKGWRARALSGLRVLQTHALVDGTRLAAIGYCFGGATVLQMAYGGAPIKGVVSFHGALPPPDVERSPTSAPKILVAHGNADPFVSEPQVKQFRAKLESTGFDWHMVIYAGARHGFTNPGAGAYGLDALKYDQKADDRSWKHMQLFFNEIFHTPH